MRITSHCALDCKPVAHINQSHCVSPSLTMAKKSVPLILKTITANPTQSDGAEVVEDLWEDSETGAGVCDGKIGRVKDVGRIG